MKILYICNEYPPLPHGGIGSFTKLIAENLIIRNHEVVVVGYGDKSTTYIEVLNGVKVVRLKNEKKDYGSIMNYFNMVVSRIVFYRKVMKYVHEFKPDLIETYDWSAPLIIKPRRITLITRLHGSNTANNIYIGLEKTPILHLLELKSIKQSDYIVSVSDHIAEITQKTFGINFKYKTIYNGVDTIKFFNQKRERDLNKILLVGRMHPFKGFDELFKALNFLFSNHNTLHLQVVCTVIESYKNELLSFVEPKFYKRIEFAGRVPNSFLIDYYNQANLSVIPSRAEALGIIALESMACGTPVIISNRAAASEIVDNELNGFLVDTSNPKTFAERILDILKDQNKIELMREKCRIKILEKFSIEKVINENINFYESIIA